MQEDDSVSIAYLSKELQKRNEEISQLKKSLSDIQVYLYQEREQVLKLFAENDVLKLKRYEDRKKIQLLLSFCNKTDKDIEINDVNPADMPRLHSSKLLSKNAKDKEVEGTSPLEALELISNAAHYNECVALYKEQIDLLIADRELVSKERSLEQEAFQEHLDILNNMLLDKDTHLREMKIVLRNYQGNIDKIKTKNKYNSNNKLVECHNHNITLYRRVVDEVTYLKRQMSHSDALIERLTEQKEILSSELSNQKDLYKKSQEENLRRIDKLSKDLENQKKNNAALEQRRILEAEGYRTDVKFLKEHMNDLDKLIAKVRSRSPAISTSKTHIQSKNSI